MGNKHTQKKQTKSQKRVAETGGRRPEVNQSPTRSQWVWGGPSTFGEREKIHRVPTGVKTPGKTGRAKETTGRGKRIKNRGQSLGQKGG